MAEEKKLTEEELLKKQKFQRRKHQSGMSFMEERLKHVSNVQ